AHLLAPVDFAWLAAFRIIYGLLLAVSMGRFLAYGFIDTFFVEPRFHFKYWGFAWVEPLPGPLLHALFALLLVLALCMAVGLFYRAAALSFALGLTYVQLLDVTTYLNHYYLAGLLAFLLAVAPATKAVVARGWLWLFRFQVGVVYVFAGLAKAESDWLLHAQPLGIWLGAATDLPVLGALFTEPWAPFLFSWCGFLFDTSIVPLLLWDRTRRFAFPLVVVFHALTSLLFPIGMFPLIMVLSALVFFPPDWPRRLAGAVGAVFGWIPRVLGSPPRVESLRRHGAPGRFATTALALGALYCATQLALPLRFLVYRGNVLWDEQGMRFSWRVMLRAKGGDTTFVVRRERDQRVFFVSPRTYLTVLQESEMSSQPDLILQLAHRIHDDFVARGHGPVAVHVESRVSLNGRRAVPFIDPTLDLARVDDAFSLARLVLPPPSADPPHTRPVL
ncbi:MAG TPA: HTTM domain-containing protein, partial [Polyangiaceae bacterium]|nr:HTTM domain-containing protein [Polyangiaceae bacterium]